MRNIGLYFGSFNPITVAHLLVANYAYNSGLVDEVWFVVTPENPAKANSGILIPLEHRVEMATLATQGCDFTKICDIEKELSRPNYTINTLNKLREDYPDDKFLIICGEDVYHQSANWKSADAVKDKCEFIVYPRPGLASGVIYGPQRGTAHFINDAPVLSISSTMIREMIKNGQSINFLVTNNVKEYINDNQLYTYGNNNNNNNNNA